jgi:hypothetical protein
MKPYHNETMGEYISRAGLDPGTDTGRPPGDYFDLDSAFVEVRQFDLGGGLESEGYVFADAYGIECVIIDGDSGSMIFGEDWILENEVMQ